MPYKILVANKDSNEYKELGHRGMKLFLIGVICLLSSFGSVFLAWISYYFLILTFGLYSFSLILLYKIPKNNDNFKNSEETNH